MKTRSGALALISLLGLAGVCRADSQDDKAAAQAAYDLGRKLSLAGNFAEACPKFEESEKLDPGLGTMLFLADCYEKTGKTASAWGEFREAEAIALKQSDARQKVAHDRASALEPRLSRVLIKVESANQLDGLYVTRDGVEIGQGVWNTPLPIDPGPHDIAASATGHKTWTEHVEIATNGTTTTVVVPRLLEEPNAVAVGNPAVLPTKNQNPSTQTPDQPPQSDGKTQRLVGVAAAGVGVVAAGFGTVFGLMASSKLSDSNADGHCGGSNHSGVNGCDATGVQARSDAGDDATISTIAFVASGVLIAGGAVLYFTAPHGKKSPVAHLAPSVGPKTAGLMFGTSW
ncbi:MAG: tetratricopeptide repeat protein [Polyangiaceae bacterium]